MELAKIFGESAAVTFTVTTIIVTLARSFRART